MCPIPSGLGPLNGKWDNCSSAIPTATTVNDPMVKRRSGGLVFNINHAAQASSFARLWGNIAELLWVEEIDIWSVDPRRKLGEDQSNQHSPVAFSFADPARLEEMFADPDLHVSRRDRAYYLRLLEKGDHILIGRLDHTIVFYGVVTFQYTRLRVQYFVHRSDEFFISRCFTKPGYRGCGIYPRAIRHVCAALADRGFRVGYLGIASHNEASIRGAIKAGAEATESHYLRLRILGFDNLVPYGPLRSRFTTKRRRQAVSIESCPLPLARKVHRHQPSADEIKILLLTDHLGGIDGGTEQHLMFLLRELPRNVFDVRFAVLGPLGRFDSTALPILPTIVYRDRCGSVWQPFFVLYHLISLIRRLKPDVVHAMCRTSELGALVATMWAGHGEVLGVRRNTGYWHTWQSRWVARVTGLLGAEYAANCDAARDFAAQVEWIPKRRVCVIRNPVPSKRLEEGLANVPPRLTRNSRWPAGSRNGGHGSAGQGLCHLSSFRSAGARQTSKHAISVDRRRGAQLWPPDAATRPRSGD